MKSIRHVPGVPERPAGQALPDGAYAGAGVGQASAAGDGKAGALPGEAAGTLLIAKDLATGWGKKKNKIILSKGISLQISGGRLSALVGPNGSGKSTLLRTLVGLQPRLGGEVLLQGKPVESLSAEERARNVACVFNERLDAGYFTVFDMVAFGRYPYTDTRNSLTGEDLAQVERAIAAVGMTAFSRRAFSGLSDGEKQKTQLARAIAQNAPILVLDEPTAFLDAPSRMEIFDLAGILAHEMGKAVVVCTHEVDLALRSADEMWVMDREHCFLSGTPAFVSFSGAIGRAFASSRARFDPASGTFRMDRRHPRSS
ncbi:MAG: ABC transporter ATP-binding protein [Spirochaetaceae bacterium]|nr:ABC transporter ATP-binding protein [Spirochaetaceae bacterium]